MIFPTTKVVGKTVKMLLAVAKSESYARNENSYYITSQYFILQAPLFFCNLISSLYHRSNKKGVT